MSGIVVVDTELTGLDEKKDSIVSIGAVRMTGGRIELGDMFYRLVSPRDGSLRPTAWSFTRSRRPMWLPSR